MLAAEAVFAAAQVAYSYLDSIKNDADESEEAEAVIYQATFGETKIPIGELQMKSIWPAPGKPDWLNSPTDNRELPLDFGPDWAFWREWYQGFLDGKPLHWELQRRVALIEDAIWEAGPEAVAAEIERIRSAYDVETRAAALEESASKSAKSIRGMGDNNPPGPICEALEESDVVTIIWDAARELKEQAQSEKPAKQKVAKAIKALIAGLKTCGLWAASKVDKGLDAAVVAGGAAGGAAGVAWITQNGEKIQKLVEVAQNWLNFLL